MSIRTARLSVTLLVALTATDPGGLRAQAPDHTSPTFAELKRDGALRSRYLDRRAAASFGALPAADLATFRDGVEPILANACYRCHGPDRQKGDLRLDELDPDLFAGDDVDWWLDVLSVLTNGEMPPPDEADVVLSDADRRRVIDWLIEQSQQASAVRRGTAAPSSVRRLARYEYAYAMQDLLGLTHDFGDDLPPDPVSHDGFENASDVLRLGGVQFRASLDAARRALELATVTGERPAPNYWSVSMAAAAAREWQRQDDAVGKAQKQLADEPAKLEAQLEKLAAAHRRRPGGAHFHDPDSGRFARQTWGYNGARHAWQPAPEIGAMPAFEAGAAVAVLPPRQGLLVELGDRIPERGMLRVRVRASRAQPTDDAPPVLGLMFGWQASNDSRAQFRIEAAELEVTAAPGAPRVYEWLVPLADIYPRNSVRGVTELGDLPNPSEYVRIVNVARSGGDLLVDHVEVAAPIYASWPPASHVRLLGVAVEGEPERDRARRALAAFLPRAWRRPVGDAEVERKVHLFDRVRPACDGFEQAMVEVLAAVLASPEFLYVGALRGDGDGDGGQPARLSGSELATRLSLFLWCSGPDERLREAGASGRLLAPAVLRSEVERMLADDKAQRFAEQFVRQWLHLELLDFLHVDRKRHPQFDDDLRAAMRAEPIAFFGELLREDHSALELLHSDFTMANERLAAHYGLRGVTGNGFRRVELGDDVRRGGLLTQAGLLAMNSDGKDSHPLKRGVWLLERLLDDPPPPPPAAVPEIDLADPEIAKMTLKQRLEDHRNSPACMSCHAKIDPWGIAFEHFDAIGSWRDEVAGQPVDAVATLFNRQQLDGAHGLKRFLLRHRQDQFVRALVKKLTTYALGRSLTFADRAALDEITGEVRRRGDGLATMVTAIAASELFGAR